MAMWIDAIETQFVRDRIRGTSFADREYVRELHLLELLLMRKSLGFAFHVQRGPERLYRTYPAEAECIRLELEEGIRVDPVTFAKDASRFAADWRAREQRRAQEALAKEEAQRRLQDKRERAKAHREQIAWNRLGGRP